MRIDQHMALLRPGTAARRAPGGIPCRNIDRRRRAHRGRDQGIAGMRTITRQAVADAKALEDDRKTLTRRRKPRPTWRRNWLRRRRPRSFEADALTRQLADTRERREGAEQEAADASRRAAAEAAHAKSLRSMLQILETQRRLEEAKAREDVLRAERDQKTLAAEAARLRQAALSRPTGAGTLAVNAKPSGQLTLRWPAFW